VTAFPTLRLTEKANLLCGCSPGAKLKASHRLRYDLPVCLTALIRLLSLSRYSFFSICKRVLCQSDQVLLTFRNPLGLSGPGLYRASPGRGQVSTDYERTGFLPRHTGATRAGRFHVVENGRLGRLYPMSAESSLDRPVSPRDHCQIHQDHPGGAPVHTTAYRISLVCRHRDGDRRWLRLVYLLGPRSLVAIGQVFPIEGNHSLACSPQLPVCP
jgi:hypothetical protein